MWPKIVLSLPIAHLSSYQKKPLKGSVNEKNVVQLEISIQDFIKEQLYFID